MNEQITRVEYGTVTVKGQRVRAFREPSGRVFMRQTGTDDAYVNPSPAVAATFEPTKTR